MSGKSAIEWTDATWNPTSGCTRVTEGCTNCYAFALHDMRHKRYQENNGIEPTTSKPMPAQYAKPFSEIRMLSQDRLEWPLHQRKPQKIFVNSMSDLFHSQIPDEFIYRVFDIMRRAHWHTFQVLTKRPGRLRRMANLLEWTPNIWIGVSIEEDKLTPRANALREVPAYVRFLSCEPLLGPLPSLDLTGIHQVITGGESGPDARQCQVEWVREIRDRCQLTKVAFFHKQWGGRTPKANGRLLDGQIWDQMPEVATHDLWEVLA